MLFGSACCVNVDDFVINTTADIEDFVARAHDLTDEKLLSRADQEDIFVRFQWAPELVTRVACSAARRGFRRSTIALLTDLPFCAQLANTLELPHMIVAQCYGDSDADNAMIEDAVLALLQHDGIDPSVNHNRLLGMCAHRGFGRVVTQLLADERVDPSARNNWALDCASQAGHQSIVSALLSDNRVDARYTHWTIDCGLPYPGHTTVIYR